MLKVLFNFQHLDVPSLLVEVEENSSYASCPEKSPGIEGTYFGKNGEIRRSSVSMPGSNRIVA